MQVRVYPKHTPGAQASPDVFLARRVERLEDLHIEFLNRYGTQHPLTKRITEQRDRARAALGEGVQCATPSPVSLASSSVLAGLRTALSNERERVIRHHVDDEDMPVMLHRITNQLDPIVVELARRDDRVVVLLQQEGSR